MCTINMLVLNLTFCRSCGSAIGSVWPGNWTDPIGQPYLYWYPALPVQLHTQRNRRAQLCSQQRRWAEMC